MTAEGFEGLPGTPLTPGEISVPLAEKAALDRVLGGSTGDGPELHPLHAYVLTQRGIGIGVAELCALAEFDMADGPMMGTMEIELSEPLLAETVYRVEGEVLDLVRKHGRSAGTFDLLSFRERLVDPEGRVAATVTNSFVLPRKELS